MLVGALIVGFARSISLVLTNGLTHYCYEQRDGAYRPLKVFPRLG